MTTGLVILLAALTAGVLALTHYIAFLLGRIAVRMDILRQEQTTDIGGTLMPQATTALTEEWNGPEETTAMDFLQSRGYVLTKDWCWIPTAGHYVSDKERRAALFLIQEWDFGGIIGPQPSGDGELPK